MRSTLAGLFLLIISASAFAQVKGEVESIGFSSFYRSNCWTPMVVRLQAEKSGIYQIKVKQKDLDSDVPAFTETISLTGSDEGNNQPQRFWTYFIPQPTNHGLADTTQGGSLRELQSQLQVFVYDEKGGKELAQLPVTSTITNVENAMAGAYQTPRSNRMIVAVSESGQPTWREYQNAIGTLEDVVIVTVRPGELPEDVRGYQAVDALLWLRAPVPDPASPADEKRFRAVQKYVQQGGHLVICQPGQREATAAWGELLPVNIKEINDRTNIDYLVKLATTYSPSWPEREALDRNVWASATGPFKVARAQPRPNSVVDDTLIFWSDQPGDVSPFIVRGARGAGCVSWVAQDLADPALTRFSKPGWPKIWDRVFDWKNETLITNNETSEEAKNPYKISNRRDLGRSLDEMMELSAKSRTLVLIAVVFFIAYWVIAGPGVYLFLASKGRSQLSWFMFGASAVAATALTVLVVKLVVRGDPELAHVTVVRQVAGEPAVAMSRFGLYIPQDGPQEILLRETAPNQVSYVTAFPVHPAHVGGDNEFPAQIPYTVPVREAAADAPASIVIPFRSTLKKMQAYWVGLMPPGLDGTAEVKDDGAHAAIYGTLGNRTGKDLKHIYIVFRGHNFGRDSDYVLYLPTWKKDQVIDLKKEFIDDGRNVKAIAARSEGLFGTPEDKSKLRGIIGHAGVDQGLGHWMQYWFAPLRSSNYSGDDDWRDNSAVRRSFPMLSLWDRLPPMKNPPNRSPDRVELLRRGARQLDCSEAVAAGNLVILAEVDNPKEPLPFPMDVNGKRVEGMGTVFYQFILPLPRNAPQPATSQPSILSRGTGFQPVFSSLPSNSTKMGLETASWRP